MWKFKSCLRCKGDIYIDFFKKEESCLQCGYRRDLNGNSILGIHRVSSRVTHPYMGRYERHNSTTKALASI